MGKSSIEWTEQTWNPVRGCTKVSPGCKHCYAETLAERFRGVKGHAYEQGFDLRLVPSKLQEPFRWRKPSMVFVNSMSDLFHEDVPDDYIEQVLAVCFLNERHTFQILTKRAVRLATFFTPIRWALIEGAAQKIYFERTGEDPSEWLGVHDLKNVWLGVSVEDRKHGLPRLELLRQTPASVRMVSFEPLLEDLGTVDLRGIGWAIVGGESGAGARPLHLAWVRSLVEQCKAADVRVFVKQLGANPVRETEDDRLWNIGISRKGGDPSEWPVDLRVREFPR